MKIKIQSLIIGILIGFLTTGGIALASTGSKTIEAFYNNIKIYINGGIIDPKDANGQPVEPFINEGTTYLPVRAVSEALGKQVSWDADTQSVYIGPKDCAVQGPQSSAVVLDLHSNDEITVAGILKEYHYLDAAERPRTCLMVYPQEYIYIRCFEEVLGLEGKYINLLEKVQVVIPEEYYDEYEGKLITVKGKVMFPHTAYHVGDIVLMEGAVAD